MSAGPRFDGPARRLPLALIFIGLFLPPFAPALAAEYTGKVVGIADGDTLTLLTAGQEQIKVRLAEIDAPERGQPYGNRAKQALADLAFGKPARVRVVDRDRYGRIVGRVYADGVDVNAELVRQGAAWVYRQYARDPDLFALEAAARRQQRGLWALPEARQPPSATVPAPAADSGAFACGRKRTCKAMTSCAEARF